MWRHGDVFIMQVEAIPEGIPATKGSVLVHGEITGHSHRLEHPANATIYAAEPTSGRDEMYLLVINPVRIIHEEHHPITLQPGMYRIWQQREYTPQAIRKVMD
jgi:hypothetical protein